MTDEQRLNQTAMKAIAPLTRINPHQRVYESQNILQKIKIQDKSLKEEGLSNLKMITIGDPVNMQGYQLKPVKIQLGKDVIDP